MIPISPDVRQLIGDWAEAVENRSLLHQKFALPKESALGGGKKLDQASRWSVLRIVSRGADLLTKDPSNLKSQADRLTERNPEKADRLLRDASVAAKMATVAKAAHGLSPAANANAARFLDDLRRSFGGRVETFEATQIRAQPAPTPGIPTLPHKHGGQASPQAAFKAGANFKLEVISRFGPLRPELQARVEAALEVWLLLGALGLRANRGGGNVWPADGTAPQTPSELRQRLDRLGCSWPVFIAGREIGDSLDALRQAATDTVDGLPHIFGKARGGREASKVRFKIVRLGGQLRLLITASQRDILDRARAALDSHQSQPDTWQEL